MPEQIEVMALPRGVGWPSGGLLVLTSAMMAATAAFAADDKPAAPETSVLVIQATRACFSQAIRVTGYLVARTDAVVTFDVDGFQVAEILAHEGQRVTSGQPLVRLVKVGGDAAAAQPGPAAALASSIVLRAPAAGRIVKSTASPGVTASPRGDPLFRLAVDDLLEIDAEVPSLYLADVKEDQTVRVEAGRGAPVEGQVRRIAAEIDPATQMGHIRIRVPANQGWHAGGFVRATVDARKSCGVSVPRSAVYSGSDGTSVQVVRGHLVETVPVRVGLLSGRNAEIREGLRVGDVVVANAGTSLRDNDRVTPTFNDAAVPSPAEPH